MGMTVGAAFERSVRCHPDEVAVVGPAGGSLTYADLDERSEGLAAGLQARLGDGRLAVLAGNGLPAVEAMLAGVKRGVATVQLPDRGAVGELADMCETAGARGLLFDESTTETASELRKRGAFETAIRAGGSPEDGVERLAAVRGTSTTGGPGLPVGDECGVFFTSGTTSTPKAVVFDGEAMWYGAIQGVMEHGIDETDVGLAATPWYHVLTTDAWLYPHLLAGATTVLQADFDPVETLAMVDAHEATGLLAVPTQLDAIAGELPDESADLSSLDYVRTAGAVLEPVLVERTRRLLCPNLYNTYGLTEAGPNLTFAHPSAQDAHTGTVGKEAMTWEVRVVEPAPLDEDPDPAADVDPGERGEVIARGPALPDGYIDNEAAERRSFVDGWLRTRDVAEVDAAGYLHVVDRVDNMFTSGGENVYPASVERAIESHEAVREACVVGLPDDRWGSVIAAVVAVEETSVTEAALETHCLEHDGLADFRRPRRWVLRTEALPRTDTGTLRREQIAAQHFD